MLEAIRVVLHVYSHAWESPGRPAAVLRATALSNHIKQMAGTVKKKKSPFLNKWRMWGFMTPNLCAFLAFIFAVSNVIPEMKSQ